MEGDGSDYQTVETPPEQMGMRMDWRPPAFGMTKGDDAFPRRLEWIAVVLFIVNFLLMMYSVSIYYREETWASVMAAIATATAVILLLSVIFSILGKTGLSKITLVAGIVGIMVSVISFGARLMQMISETGDYW